MAQQAAQLPTLSGAVHHFLKVSASYHAGLFHCYRVPDLPRTNNDLEHYFGTGRLLERRATGRKAAGTTLVLRGPVRLVASVATYRHAFRAQELIPHDLAAWRTLRSALQVRHDAHRSQFRFRRDPQAFLTTLEEQFLQLDLPS